MKSEGCVWVIFQKNMFLGLTYKFLVLFSINKCFFMIQRYGFEVFSGWIQLDVCLYDTNMAKKVKKISKSFKFKTIFL